METTHKDIYVIAAHPAWRESRVNRPLMQAAQGLLRVQVQDLWLVATTGGPDTSYHPQGYNRYFFDAFLPPYEQTAALCGMRFLPPLVLHGAHTVAQDIVTKHIATFRQRLGSYPNWPEMDDLEQCAACVVPMKDRPEEHRDGAI